ncbi:allophanate hydrolase subunit 1 [Gordonia sinesedis]
MRELPAGPDAVLLDFAADPDPAASVRAADHALRIALSAGRLSTVTDVVPAAETVLITAESESGIDILGIHRVLRADGVGTDTTAAEHAATSDGPAIEIPVHYDGPDLDDVAAALGTDTATVVALHHGTRWRVQFMGFAPGFGYLVPVDDPDNPLTTVGRRAEPRTHVGTGAVAIAAGYSAVYPKDSPGGWNILGHSDIGLWNIDTDPPSLLTPGALVRFRDAGGRP